MRHRLLDTAAGAIAPSAQQPPCAERNATLSFAALTSASAVPCTRPPEEPRYSHRDLEQIAMVCLACARVLLETGSRSRAVHQCCETIAAGSGARALAVRVGYASISLTLVSGSNTITRMTTVHCHGVDHRLNQAVEDLVAFAARTRMQPDVLTARLDAIVAAAPHYPPGLVAMAVGLACAAFGGLLGTDLLAFAPIGIAGGCAQWLRHCLLRRGVNTYVCTGITSFAAALLCGAGARLVGSGTVNLAMMAATLLVIPGIPATNAQADILDGFPTMGSARAISVLMAMVFIALGLLAAQSVAFWQ